PDLGGFDRGRVEPAVAMLSEVLRDRVRQGYVRPAGRRAGQGRPGQAQRGADQGHELHQVLGDGQQAFSAGGLGKPESFSILSSRARNPSGAVAAATAPGERTSWPEALRPWLFVGPSLILLLAVGLYPILYTFYISA